MRIETEDYLDFSQVLLKPKRSTLTSRSEAELIREFKPLYYKNSINVLPIMCSNMDTVGTFDAAQLMLENRMAPVLHKHYRIDELLEFLDGGKGLNLFMSMGGKQQDYDNYVDISDQLGYYPHICIDIANGYSENFIEFIKQIRRKVQDDALIMAGNVATPEMTEELIFAGADIVKVGIGSGAMCTTRYVAGVGVPQFSCTAECSDAAHGIGGLVCSDGGITCPGDVVKAFGAGADFVMVGSEFAGHSENAPKVVKYGPNGKPEKIRVYGMSSDTAMIKHYGKVENYRSSEGRTVEIERRGPLQTTIDYYLGGLRSGMTYIGAKYIKEIPKRATFIKVSKILNNTYDESTLRFK